MPENFIYPFTKHQKPNLTDPWDAMYALPWEVLFHMQRSDTVWNNTARTTPITDNAYIRGVTDLSGNGNHGVQDAGLDSVASFRWDGTRGRTYESNSGQNNHQRIKIPEIDLTAGGTIMFLVEFDPTQNYSHRYLRHTSTSFTFQLNAADEVNITTPTTNESIQIPYMLDGTMMIMVTFENTGANTVHNVYVNSPNLKGTATSGAVADVRFTSIGNLSGGSGVSVIKDGFFAFGASTQIFDYNRRSQLMNLRQLIIDEGVL